MISIPYYPMPDFVPKAAFEVNDFQDMFNGIKYSMRNIADAGLVVLSVLLVAGIVAFVFRSVVDLDFSGGKEESSFESGPHIESIQRRRNSKIQSGPSRFSRGSRGKFKKESDSYYGGSGGR